MFDIKITYKTGNSFGSQTESDLLGCSFETVQEAKDALVSIREHNEYFDEINSYSFRRSHKTSLLPDKEWLVKGDMFSSEHSLMLKSSGELKRVSAFWRGYFEYLIAAEVKIDMSDLIYETNRY
jgi:hypothetical protein